jgi:hypothetical protein
MVWRNWHGPLAAPKITTCPPTLTALLVIAYKKVERHHIHRLEQLGYIITLSPKEVA